MADQMQPFLNTVPPATTTATVGTSNHVGYLQVALSVTSTIHFNPFHLGNATFK